MTGETGDLNRPLSPIRHDYKPNATSEATKSNALPWFAAGLGLPILGIALLLANGSESSSEPTAVVEPDATPVVDAGVAVEAEQSEAIDLTDAIELAEADVVPVAEPAAAPIEDEFHPPLALPPEYDKLQLTVKTRRHAGPDIPAQRSRPRGPGNDRPTGGRGATSQETHTR